MLKLSQIINDSRTSHGLSVTVTAEFLVVCNTGCLKKSRPSKTFFGIFSLQLSLFAWSFANLLAIQKFYGGGLLFWNILYNKNVLITGWHCRVKIAMSTVLLFSLQVHVAVMVSAASWQLDSRLASGYTLGCMAGLTLALVCVAASGQLVVIQWEAWVRGDQRLTKVLTKSSIRHVPV